MLKGWTLFEKMFLILGTIISTAFTFIFKGPFIDSGYTLLYFWTALLLAK